MDNLPPFTTTPELRQGVLPPYTDTSLQVNLFFRVFLGIMANIVCWVPMRLLWKNGEFSAAVWCICTMVLNVYYVVNSLLWRDNNVADWYAGYGWCDLQMYTVFPLETLYAACIFEILRNLASKVAMTRATGLTSSEQRRRILIESLVIFTFPLIQVITTYFFLAQRYNVATLIGCGNDYYKSWQYVVVFHVPTNCFTVLTTIWAGLTWYRFWKVDKITRTARNHSSSGMHARHQRLRRKLFFMCMSVLIPFLPMQLFWLYYNIAGGLDDLQPYDFAKVHDPATFNLVTFTTSQGLNSLDLNGNYMAIITVVPIFLWFGFTKEAVNTYREYCLNVGLGRFFPKLHDEYEPDRTRSANTARSWGRNLSEFLRSGRGNDGGAGRSKSSEGAHKNSILPSFQHVSMATSTATASSSRCSGNEDMDAIDHITIVAPTKTDSSNRWPDVTIAEPAAAATTAHTEQQQQERQHRNPFIFRTALSNPLHILTHGLGNTATTTTHPAAQPPVSLSDLASPPTSHPHHPGPAPDSPAGSSRDGGGGAFPWTAVDSGAAAAAAAASSKAPKVQTRVWSSEDDDRRLAAAAAAAGWKRAEAEAEEEEVEGSGGARGEGAVRGVRVETRIARSERML